MKTKNVVYMSIRNSQNDLLFKDYWEMVRNDRMKIFIFPLERPAKIRMFIDDKICLRAARIHHLDLTTETTKLNVLNILKDV